MLYLNAAAAAAAAVACCRAKRLWQAWRRIGLQPMHLPAAHIDQQCGAAGDIPSVADSSSS
jgi:hypothetical protein